MAAFCSISIALTLENGIALVEQTAGHNRNIMRIWLPIGDVPIGWGKIVRLTDRKDGRNCSRFANALISRRYKR
jgi:hypothetical protein